MMHKSIGDVLEAVSTYLTTLNTQGGEVSLHIQKTFETGTRGSVLRPSNAGKCARALAFAKLYPEGKEPLSNRAYNVFWHGDVLQCYRA